jgi:hypothetical protein
MSATRVRTSIDWEMVYLDRRCALAAMAAAAGAAYSADQATRIVAMTIREDAQRAWRLAQWLIQRSDR